MSYNDCCQSVPTLSTRLKGALIGLLARLPGPEIIVGSAFLVALLRA